MDPMQLQMMQEMQSSGLPGMYAPMAAGNGMAMLQRDAQYMQPKNMGNPYPDIYPLAPLQLQQFGMPGMLAGMAGNAYLSDMMAKQGIMPRGNTGSYMQAFRAQQFQQMQQEVAKQVAPQDEEGIYRTFRGAAAMAGMPFNRQQRQAARSLSGTIAQFGPVLGMMAPEFLDAISGERGSVQALSSQMMHANRYQVDPTTGQLGYSTKSNTAMVNDVFSTMFADDNMAKMHGMRAGDVGQIYNRLSGEGLVGPRGSVKDRTLLALQSARAEGVDLQALGAKAGVAVGGNLASLSNDDLQKLRETSPISEKLTKGDSTKVTSQIQEYIGTLSAMREIFGENGNPNAPIPELIGALQALTSGQMQKFDAAKLNTMVRDMQSLSQMSGKSLDQYLIMNKTAVEEGKAMGIGTTFANTATNVGITTGMAFQERGGVTGFGALNRESAEITAMSLFNRGMASEMNNTLGALGRIEDAGGFADNDAGKRLTAAMTAARAGDKTYTFNGNTYAVPTKEAEFRSLIGQGAVEGMNRSSFNQMLGDRTSNLRKLSDDPELQQAAFNQQRNEIDERIARTMGERFSTDDALKGVTDTRDRNRIATSLGVAANLALSEGMTQEQRQDTKFRDRTIADAIKAEAANNGVQIEDKAALNMAAQAFGQAERVAKSYDMDSYTAYSQVLGGEVAETRRNRQAQVKARSGLNEAMSTLGPQGSMLQRGMTALQKQGDRGEKADLTGLFGDMFGTDLDSAKAALTPQLEDIRNKRNRAEELRGQLDGASPAETKRISAELDTLNKDITARVAETNKVSAKLGIGGGSEVFNREDIHTAMEANRKLTHLTRSDQVRMMSSTGAVTPEDRQAIAASSLTSSDISALAVRERDTAMKHAVDIAKGDVNAMPKEAQDQYNRLIAAGRSPEAARDSVRQTLQSAVGTQDKFAVDIAKDSGVMNIGNLSEEEQKTVVMSRRYNTDLKPDAEAVRARSLELRKIAGLSEDMTKLTDAEKRSTTNTAEDQLIAENQLRNMGALQKGQSLSASAADIAGYANLDPALRTKLAGASQADRAGLVNDFLDKSRLSQYFGTSEAIEQRRLSALVQQQTAEGQLSISNTDDSIDAMAGIRREFLLDDKATTRGGARAIMALQQNKDAHDSLQTSANRYFEGSIGAMLSGGGMAMGEKGLKNSETDFAGLSDSKKSLIADRLRADGVDIGVASNLTVGSYRAYLSLEASDNAKALGESISGFAGATGQTYANLLKPTKATIEAASKLLPDATESDLQAMQALNSAAMLQGRSMTEALGGMDVKSLVTQLASGGKVDTTGMTDEQKSLVGLASGMQGLTGLSREQLTALEAASGTSQADITAGAVALGITPEEYAKMMHGGAVDSKLRLFTDSKEKGTAAEQLTSAQDDVESIANDELRLSKVQAKKASNQQKGVVDEQLDKEIGLISSNLGERKTRKSEAMKAAGLEPGKAEDEITYQKRLQSQGHLAVLETRRTEFTAKREELRAGGMSEADIDKNLDTIQSLNEQSDKVLADFKETDLGDVMNPLAEGFGLDADISNKDARQAFSKAIGSGTSADEANQRMVATAFDRVNKMDGLEGENAGQRLDKLTDEWAEAKTPEQKAALAKKRNISEGDLDKMMRQTEFLGMREDTDGYSTEDAIKGMSAASQRDIGKEVKEAAENKFTITGGTINFVGDVTGTGTVSSITAVGQE